MRAQKIALVVASVVTGLFLTAVGAVLIGQMVDFSRPANQPRVAQDNAENQIVQFAPIPNLQMVNPIERPVDNVQVPQNPVALAPAKEIKISGPHAHGNLAIFLVHGPDTIKNPRIMTLQEAVEQNLAVVHDRGSVVVENRGDAPLFIQSGDIVKGGNQDRVLPYDMLLSTNTSSAPVPAFCVESGRSRPRGNEMSSAFQVSSEQLPTRQLKLAAYRFGQGNAQGEVWNQVSNLQTNLARNLGDVRSKQSTTSLQLTLEHPRVQENVKGYVDGIAPAVAGQDDVIGYVVAINGKIQSADVYGSNALFQKVWPKLVKAGAVEALAEQGQGNVAAPSVENVQRFLSAADRGTMTKSASAGRSAVQRRETPQQLVHETFVPEADNAVLHRSFLAK